MKGLNVCLTNVCVRTEDLVVFISCFKKTKSKTITPVTEHSSLLFTFTEPFKMKLRADHRCRRSITGCAPYMEMQNHLYICKSAQAAHTVAVKLQCEVGKWLLKTFFSILNHPPDLFGKDCTYHFWTIHNKRKYIFSGIQLKAILTLPCV